MARGTSVTLTGHSEKFVSEQVESGHFSSVSDVVQEGLRLLEAHQRQMDWLREQIAHGRDQVLRGQFHADSAEFWETLNRDVDERLRRGEQPSPHVCP